jgi:hypothetical protein
MGIFINSSVVCRRFDAGENDAVPTASKGGALHAARSSSSICQQMMSAHDVGHHAPTSGVHQMELLVDPAKSWSPIASMEPSTVCVAPQRHRHHQQRRGATQSLLGNESLPSGSAAATGCLSFPTHCSNGSVRAGRTRHQAAPRRLRRNASCFPAAVPRSCICESQSVLPR